MSSILDMIFEFKELLIIGIALGGVFFLISSIKAGNITWKSRNMRLFGAFMGLNVREMLWMSAGVVRILFVICVCTFTLRLGIAHMAFYIALVMLSIITFFGFPRVLIDLVNASAVYVSLMAMNILIGYYRDINNEPMILLIYILLSVFTVLYSVYFYMRGISDLIICKLDDERWMAVRK